MLLRLYTAVIYGKLFSSFYGWPCYIGTPSVWLGQKWRWGMGDGRRKKGNKRPDARSLGPVDKDPPPQPPIVFGHPWFAV